METEPQDLPPDPTRAPPGAAAWLETIGGALDHGVLVCLDDGTVSFANAAARALIPGPLARYGDVLDHVDRGWSDAPALGVRGGPVVLRTRAEPRHWIELDAHPVGDATGGSSAGSTVVLIRDITEARRLTTIRETFVGVLSHELRTPVTTIYGGAQLLARDGSTLDEATRQSILEDIVEETERLHRLVEDVVALNRFGETAGDIRADPVLIQRLLPRLLRSEEARWPGVTFQMDIAPNLPTVLADETYVEQVTRNLTSNAAKFGGSGTTVMAQVSSDADEVQVRILDDGPGIDDAETERLFELFYRSPATALTATGAGIGLFVSSRLTEAMGGRIWAHARPQGGAEFGFALRVASDS